MFGTRLLTGAIIGGAAMYFLDPKHGTERRARLRGWWDENQGPVRQAVGTATTAAEARVNDASVTIRERAAGLRSNRTQGQDQVDAAP
ncbi:MAG: YtxH domain-containing protein [Candidatus Dormibacteraeota bacterium]|nr:YtxH domain-containing protein [Candidatus Dormibacteraeota bacterium]